MKNVLEELYLKTKAIENELTNEENGLKRDELIQKMNNILKPLDDCSPAVQLLWNEYRNSRDNGNILPDINRPVEDGNAKEMISAMVECGIEHFTFSSAWSGAVETAWLFTEAGCQLEGLVTINGLNKTIPAYQFKLPQKVTN